MSVTALEQLVTAMADVRVLCVGDLILDRFIYGDASRISREAPVAVVNQTHREFTLGAAGNVARSVAALGGQALLAAVVGDDPEGHSISRMLSETDFADVELVTAKGRMTPMKTRYVAGGQQVLCVDRNPEVGLDDEAQTELIQLVEGAVGDCDVVVISDYGRGVLDGPVLSAVIRAAVTADKPVVADPRGRDFSAYDGCFVLKPNVHELARETGMACDTDEQLERAIESVLGRLHAVEHLVVTRGAKGMARRSRGSDQTQWFRATPRDVFDISGAGDISAAGLAMAVAAGASPTEAIAFANRAAGLGVTKMGTAIVTAEEVVADAHGRSLSGAPIADLGMAGEVAARWRADGARIGLTNGCFDLLHVGHVNTINRARSLCDRLVVGVNADASVRRLKGEARPINSQTDRAWLVSALGAVDMVVVFEDDTAIPLVEALKPDVYVKGGDYNTVDSLPETAAVRAFGGEVALAPLAPNRSTSELIRKIMD